MAYGYFYNSLKPACKQLFEQREIRVHNESKTISNFQFKVLIPDDLRSDMKDKVTSKKSKDKWIQVDIPTSATRSYIFYTPESALDLDNLVIMDIPTTLNSLYQTIKEFVGSGKVGQGLKEKLVEQREIRHFQKVVNYLIDSESLTKGLVSTEIVDI